jgi:hypothetical protein
VSAGYTSSKHNNFVALCNVHFEEDLPEDDQNSWPKHVVGYAVCNEINLHIVIRSFGLIYHHESPVSGHE